MQTADQLLAPIDRFAERMAALPARHPRRIGLVLGQAGLLITVACFCISIAGMNVGLVMTLVGCVLAGAPLHRTIGVGTLLGWLVLLGLSTLPHGEGKELISSAVIPIGLLTAQVVFHPALPGAARLRQLVSIVMVVAVLVAVVVALGQYVIGRGSNRPFRIDPAGEHIFRSSGFFSIHLTQGVVMGMMFFLLAPVTSGLRSGWRWLAIAAAAIGVAIGGARAALLGFVVAMASAIAAQGRRFLIIGGIAGVVLLSVVLSILYLTQPIRFQRLLEMQDGRWPIWQTTVHLIGEHPWVGTGGTDSFRKAYVEAYPQVVPGIPNEFPKGAPHAHNTQLAHAVEHGIPFAIAWLVLLLVPLAALWRARVGSPAIWRAAIGMGAMVLIFGQFEKLDGEASRVLWTGLGMLLALASAQATSGNALVASRAANLGSSDTGNAPVKQVGP